MMSSRVIVQFGCVDYDARNSQFRFPFVQKQLVLHQSSGYMDPRTFVFLLVVGIIGVNAQTYKPLEAQTQQFYQYASVSLLDWNKDDNVDLFYTGLGPQPESQDAAFGHTVLELRDASGKI